MACGDTTFELFVLHIDNDDNDGDVNAAFAAAAAADG